MSAIANTPPGGPDPRYTLAASGNLRRRQAINRTFEVFTIGAAGLAVAVLFILVYYAAKNGIGQLSLGFLFDTLPAYGGVGGGMGPALAGTAEAVLIATLIAVPAGVLTAIYLTEFSGPRLGKVLITALELMAGLPTILAGVFIYGLVVAHTQQSAYAAGFALAIVEVPLIARASIESLRRVPSIFREGADALGVAHWRTVVGVILPTASSGITTAVILAVARAAGETAPVLLTTSAFQQTYQLNPTHAVATIPMEILTLLNSGQPSAVNKAWGAAFLLMVVILVVNIGARVWLRRSERKRGL